MEEFKKIYDTRKQVFEEFLSSTIKQEITNTFNPILANSSLYSLLLGGKRFRPVLSISAYLTNHNQFNSGILYLASAIECIHTYSLVHDDLPAMDNDDFRRGSPTCHKQFSEAIAILAGDALNSFGFFLISKLDSLDPQLYRDLLFLLHQGAGGPGMVSGQIEDIESENKKSNFSEEVLHSIHQKKTGALITSSLLIGNRLSTNWQFKEKWFKTYGQKIGMLFQITDDIIDIESTLSELGKTPGKDANKGKLTFPAFYGMDKSKRMRDELKEELVDLSGYLEQESIFFRKLPVYIVNRKS